MVLLIGMWTLAFSSTSLVKALWVWDLPIPYVPLASEVTLNGEITEEAWCYSKHFHDYSTIEKTIEFDFYLMHDGVSIYIGAKIYDNDFSSRGVLGDSFEVEINDRNDGHYGGSSGNDWKFILVTPAGPGDYYDAYIPLDARLDTKVDGEGAFTFSGLRQDGETGDYYFEMKIPIDGSHPEDAKLCEGVPFGMMTSFTDYDPTEDVGVGCWLLQGSYILEARPPTLSATLDINPNTLNLRSRGRWITAYIELPEGYDVHNINVSTVMSNDTIPAQLNPIAIGDYDNDTVPDLMVKFSRAEVIAYILANVNMEELREERVMEVTLTITGRLNDGTLFQGSTTIKIILPMSRGRYYIIPYYIIPY
jgi:hypothetical protein